MKQNQFKLCLQPLSGSSCTLVVLRGALSAAPPPGLSEWLRELSRWANGPVELALPVDEGTVEWFDSWADLVNELPEHRLLLRLTHRAHPLATGVHDAG